MAAGIERPAVLVLLAFVIANVVSAGSLGRIYALPTNGTTNELNAIAVDLTTWETQVGPSLGPQSGTFGQAAL